MEYLNKSSENTAQPIQAKSRSKPSFHLEDNRKSSIIQRKQIASISGHTVQFKNDVVQLVSDAEVAVSMRNIAAYTSLLKSYDATTIERVLRANHLNIKGHASGAGGDGMNDATRRDLATLTRALQADAGAQRSTEESKEYSHYGAAPAASSSSSSSGKHQTDAEKKATDAKKKERENEVAERKRQAYLAKKALE